MDGDTDPGKGTKVQAQRVPTDEVSSSPVEIRLAVLEERTNFKPKSVLDYVKDWSGVATAIIALLYTIPLGVWDRFVETSKQAEEKKVGELRNVIIQLSELEANIAQNYGAIKDPAGKASFVRAISSQRAALIYRVEPLIKDHYNGLSVPELMLLGYDLGQAGKIETAETIYADALQKSKKDATPIAFAADIYRMEAQLYSSLPSGPDMPKIRTNYSQNISILLGYKSPNLLSQAANSVVEWAILEQAAGDWRCGEQLGDWIKNTLSNLQLLGIDSSSLLNEYNNELQLLKLKPEQPQLGCQKDLIVWMEK